MAFLFFVGFILFFIGCYGISKVDITSPTASTYDAIVTIVFLLGIICITSSVTLYIAS